MTRFHGTIGYAHSTETVDGVWRDVIVEKIYSGDIFRLATRWDTSEQVSDNLVVNHNISIVADPYAFDNFFAMKYVRWVGTYWKIKSVEVQRPRIILNIGGIYNGETLETTPDP